MREIRTDLVCEARELWREASPDVDMPGVTADEKEVQGFKVTTVDVTTGEGEKAVGKPVGRYITIDIEDYLKREEDGFSRAVKALAGELSRLFSNRDGTVLVAGLGNPDITPDAVGPIAVKNTMVTLHLVEQMPETFSGFKKVAAISPGVLAVTGIESARLIRAAAKESDACTVIVVDALASRKLSRLCRTVQISNTGITPGSGVGNSRQEISMKTIGVPVISLGVPTVVDAKTLAADLMENNGKKSVPEDFSGFGSEMMVTPREIDKCVADVGKLIGYGINVAIQGIGVDDVTMFIE